MSSSDTCGLAPSKSDLLPHRNIFAFSAYVTMSNKCCDKQWNDVALSKEKTSMAASANL